MLTDQIGITRCDFKQRQDRDEKQVSALPWKRLRNEKKIIHEVQAWANPNFKISQLQRIENVNQFKKGGHVFHKKKKIFTANPRVKNFLESPQRTQQFVF